MKISLDKLQQAPWYFRDELGGDLRELGISIAERQEEPILIAKQEDGSYMVVDGWRRITAAKKARVTELEFRSYEGTDPLFSALVMAHFDKSHDSFQLGGGLTEWLQKQFDTLHNTPVPEHGNVMSTMGPKKLPTPAAFISTIRRERAKGKEAWAKLNKALGDPVGFLERSFGPLETIEDYLRVYRDASEQTKLQVREGAISATTARELGRRWRKQPELQDKIANKSAKEGLGSRDVIKGSKVLKTAKGDKDLEDTILELDWSQPEEEIRDTAGVIRATSERHSKSDDFKQLPAVKDLLNKIADFANWVYTGAKMVEIGKVSPEGRRFIANKVDNLIERLTKFKEELLWDGGAQKPDNE